MITTIKTFIHNALNYDKDISELNKEITKYKVELAELKDEMIIITEKKDAAENQLKLLLEEHVVDINEIKEWYETRFGDAGWFYPYDSGSRKDVKNVFKLSSSIGATVIRELSIKILEENGLQETEESYVSPVDIITCVKRYFSHKNEWTYVTDMQEHGVPEYWAPADVSAKTRRGDCDSLAILMHVLILDMFEMFNFNEYGWRLKLTAGIVLGEGGHAYNIWLHDDGEWYVIESTYDLKGSFARTWLKTPVRNNNMYVDFWGFARPDRSFKGFSLGSLNNQLQYLSDFK